MASQAAIKGVTEATRLLYQAIAYTCTQAERLGWTEQQCQIRRGFPAAREAEAAMDAACLTGDGEAVKRAARAWWAALGVTA